jgi:hypothetical protein
MPTYPTDERSVLHSYWLVPMATAKVIDVPDRLRMARTTGLVCHMPARSFVISAPVHRKSKKIEVTRTFSAFLIERGLSYL